YLHPHRSHLAHLPRVVPQTPSIVCDHTHITSSQHPKSINQCLWGAVCVSTNRKIGSVENDYTSLPYREWNQKQKHKKQPLADASASHLSLVLWHG
ncbi:MAG: hypothetical protein MR843_01655, partial [Bacteroidales bacterium]|nr:hypothetical protein [Bacteroidales bacterium]